MKVPRPDERWLHRPMHRDWAFWACLAAGVGYWVYALQRQSQYGPVSWADAAVNLPLQVAAGAVSFAILVGCIRQFRVGRAEGRPRSTLR